MAAGRPKAYAKSRLAIGFQQSEQDEASHGCDHCGLMFRIAFDVRSGPGVDDIIETPAAIETSKQLDLFGADRGGDTARVVRTDPYSAVPGATLLFGDRRGEEPEVSGEDVGVARGFGTKDPVDLVATPSSRR
jgi:hypothetical protein